MVELIQLIYAFMVLLALNVLLKLPFKAFTVYLYLTPFITSVSDISKEDVVAIFDQDVHLPPTYSER